MLQDSDTPVPSKKGTTPQLTREQEADMYKQLAHKTYKVIGREMGFYDYYETDKQVVARVMYVVGKVRKAPDLYGISQDAVDVVEAATRSRSFVINPLKRAELRVQKIAEQESFKDKLQSVRDTAAEILLKKLEKLQKGKNGIDDISFRDIKDILGTAIDKTRLLRGESTENVITSSKIDVSKLTPQESLEVIIKAREALMDSKK